jgi:hypothetical protein
VAERLAASQGLSSMELVRAIHALTYTSSWLDAELGTGTTSSFAEQVSSLELVTPNLPSNNLYPSLL